jgi:hypothetical protein
VLIPSHPIVLDWLTLIQGLFIQLPVTRTSKHFPRNLFRGTLNVAFLQEKPKLYIYIKTNETVILCIVTYALLVIKREDPELNKQQEFPEFYLLIAFS